MYLIQPAGRSGADGRFEARGQAAPAGGRGGAPRRVGAVDRGGRAESWGWGGGAPPENAALTVAPHGGAAPRERNPNDPPLRRRSRRRDRGAGTRPAGRGAVDARRPRVYRSSPIPKNTVTVCVASPSVVADFATVDLRETERAELALRPASKLEVEVVDESGEPIAGVSIRAESPNAPDWLKSALPASFPLAHWAMLPAGHGSHRRRRPRADRWSSHGSVSLVLSHPGFAESEESVSIPTPRLRLTLGARPVLAGRVLVGGQPISERQLLVAVRTRAIRSGSPRPDPTFPPMTKGDSW